MHKRFPRLYRHLAARFSPTEVFGLHLTLGLAVLAAAAWIFGRIAGDVFSGAPIAALDLALASHFHSYKNSSWTPLFLFLTHWHNSIGLLAMASLCACYLARRRAWYWLLALVLAVPGGMLLNVLLKYIYQRARPHFDEPLLSLATYSFPSGHALGATVFYGMLAAWAVCHTRRLPLRMLAVLAAASMIALVALSRVYLGVHYLSDVLAGFTEGCAWLAICITAVSTLRRRRNTGE
ncbi:MAG: phosphatase PAP2 family protein [Pseudomonadota bacterium]